MGIQSPYLKGCGAVEVGGWAGRGERGAVMYMRTILALNTGPCKVLARYRET